MKKIDALVKRVEFFERLAVYGNRSSFLKSLAQDQSVMPPPEPNSSQMPYGPPAPPTPAPSDQDKVKSIIKEMEKLLKDAGVDNQEILAPFGNASLFGKVDVSAISNAATKAISDPKMTTIVNADKVTKLIQLQQQLRIASGAGAGAAPAPAAAKPAASSLLQKSKQQIAYMTRLADSLKTQTGPAKANSLKQINSLVASLQASLKNSGGWGEIKDYIVGRKLVTDALQGLYNNKLEYDDLAGVPALDFGRGVPEAAY